MSSATSRLLLSLAPAPRPLTLPLALKPAEPVLMLALRVSFRPATGAVLATPTLWPATTSPTWTMPKSTTGVVRLATAVS